MTCDHVFGAVDDCIRCIYCEVLPGRDALNYRYLRDEVQVVDDDYLAPRSYRYDY